MELREFIEARLAEDERGALIGGMQPEPWQAITNGPYGPAVRTGTDDDPEWSREVNSAMWQCDDEADGCPEVAREWIAEARHIARHDPARVLREVAAKRAIMKRYVRATEVPPSVAGYIRGQDSGYAEACLDALRDLATAWADHPDYRTEWSVT